MTRKPKYWTYWILAFSLNLIPLVAQGQGGGPHADPVTPPVTPPVAKPEPKIVKTKVGVPQKYDRKAPVDPAAPPLTPNGEVSDTPPCNEARMYKKGNKHVINGGYSRVQKCEQAVWQKKNPSSRRPPAGTKPPENKTAPDPVAKQDPKDLSFADVKTLIKDFDYVRDGDNITGTVKLRGRIFKDCEDKLEIVQINKTDSKDESCKKNAAGYIIRDLGGFKACMEAHTGANAICSNSAGPNQCVFLSDNTEKRKTMLPMGLIMTMGEIQLVRANPDGNEDRKHKCESFPTPIEHVTQTYVNECRVADEKKAFERQLEIAKHQAKSCTHTTEELAIAKSACEWLTHIGQFTTVEECTKNLDKKEIEILKNLASKGPVDGLEEVTSSIIEWANNHPNECGKAVDVLQEIARRHAKRKGTRGTDSEATPFDGMNAAVDTFERAAEEAPCLTEDSKFLAMQSNLKANRTLKICQIGGICTAECMSAYHEVLQNAYQNYTDTCSSGGWQMDNSCMAAARNFQTALTIPQKAQAELMRQSQATQQLMATAMQPQGGGQYGGGQQYGGGINTFQVPGQQMPGMGGVPGGGGPQGFMMPGSPTLGSTRPGGGYGSSGYGFGIL